MVSRFILAAFAAVFVVGVNAQLNVDFANEDVQAVLIEMQDNFNELGLKGVVIREDVQLKKLSDRLFDFTEGPARADLTNNGALAGVRINIFNNLYANLDFGGGVGVNDFLLDDALSLDEEQEQALDDATPLFSLIVINEEGITHGGNVFCIFDQQCKGNRLEAAAVSYARTCLDQGDGLPDLCDDFVTRFTVIWLTVLVFLVYVIFIVWFLYMIFIPWFKRRCGKNKGKSENTGRAPITSDEQLMLNTLASQCASSENLLFRATEIMKYAERQKKVVTVEARREAKILHIAATYFQTLAAIVTVLTHNYMNKKTQRGERLDNIIDDVSVRALQIEVLRYVKERLNLAMTAEAFSEESLVRIGEAYAILKKVMSNITLVGFDWNVKDDRLQYVKTPQPQFDENAFFMHGTYSASGDMRGDNRLDGQEVYIAMAGADNLGIKTSLPANYYLSNDTTTCWNFSKDTMSVEKTKGRALAFRFNNAGSRGDTLKFFARQFWGQEISNIQNQAMNWMKSEDGLERFLEEERYQQEDAAMPYLSKGEKRRRKKYDDDMNTTFSDETGYTVKSRGQGMVFNAKTVINMGLSVAGKGGLPYDNKSVEEKPSLWKRFAVYMPNSAEWPKFHLIVFVIIPITIMAAMLAKIGQGSTAIDVDGNVDFLARPAGYGFSFLGVPNYHFLDGFIPLADDLVAPSDLDNEDLIATVFEAAGISGDGEEFPQNGVVFMTNDDVAAQIDEFNALFGRAPDFHVSEIQSGILAQLNADGVTAIRDQQEAQKVTQVMVYAFMHTGCFFFAIIPFSLTRELWEILAKPLPIIRSILPLGLWRDIHMQLGLSMLIYVTLGATLYVVQSLVGNAKRTPFSGFAGDPNIPDFFDFDANVLYLRMLLLPPVPLLLLMKYADRGPPRWWVNYMPVFISKWYFEMCYFLHLFTAATMTIMLVLYRPQVFYWVGAAWGFGYGVNKIIRIVRTKKTTIADAELISYTVEDKRSNAKKKTAVLRLSLNVPKTFPASSRGQAVWILAPNIDYVAHPFTIAKVPDADRNDQTITLHIGIKYMYGDDVISYARPDRDAKEASQRMAAPGGGGDGELPPGWKEAMDPESGQTYFYNSAMKRTTWTRPKNNQFRNLTMRLTGGVGGFRTSTAMTGNGSLSAAEMDPNGITITRKSTWTQKMAALTQKLQALDPDLRENKLKQYPVYVSAPLGTSFDNVLQPSLPGSVIIVTQNGLPAAEASVRWLLSKSRKHRPKYFYFVSVSRQVNDALTIVETLRNSICQAVADGNIDIDALDVKNSHMCDWLGVNINLTKRKGSTIEGDRDMLLRSLSPPKADVSAEQLDTIETWLKNRVNPGRLPFDRFLKRCQASVKARTGSDKMAVGYCGSSRVAGSIRLAVNEIPNMQFEGEYI